MRRTAPVDEVVASWERTLSSGGEVLLVQSRRQALGYLLTSLALTALCLAAALSGTLWGRLGDVVAILGVIFFGAVCTPVMAVLVVRGRQPIVKITDDRVRVGSEVVPLGELTGMRPHSGSFAPVTRDVTGGVSLFVGERHVELPLPPGVPTGAVVEVLRARAPQADVTD